jgi:nicotinamide riboside kinase
MKTKIVNMYGGPGTGKSTTAAGLFSELKMRNVNCEYVQEYAKDKAWEFGDTLLEVPKVFQAQEYIFGKQHFRIRRCADDVEVIITDCPLLLGHVYMPPDFPIPSLRLAIREAYDLYDNLDIFLIRQKEYNPKGRLQTEPEAKELDTRVQSMLSIQEVDYKPVFAGRNAVEDILVHIQDRWGDLSTIKP